VTLAASQANRASVLILATIATMMSRSWLLVPAGVALAAAFGAVFARRAHQRVNAVIGALSIQVVLRWPAVGFHGSTALVAVVAVAPVLLSAWSGQRRRSRRTIAIGTGVLLGVAVVFSLPLAIGGFLARTPLNRGIAATHSALSAATHGDAASASVDLRIATADLGRAHGEAGSWWSLGASLVPGLAQQRQAVATATSAVRTLTAAAEKETAGLDISRLSVQHGQIDLAEVTALRGPLVALDSQVAVAQRALAHSPSEWLVGPIATRLSRLSNDLARAHRSADLGVQAVDDAPALLGGDGVRHYFVAFMTPAETRGLDGLIGAYGELTVDHGHLSLARAGQIGELDRVLDSAVVRLTGLAQYQARYGTFDPTRYFQDVAYSPDFPTVGQVISELYPQAGGDHIDGVLALDPAALSVLLRFTGPLDIPGLPAPLTASNATNVLLRQQYVLFPTSALQPIRNDFLQNALQSAFGKISSGALPNPRTLATALAAVTQEGRFLFWSDHPSDQPLLHGLGVDGAFPEPGPGSDLLAVTVSNAANNKIDAYLYEGISDHVTYDPATGHVSATVTLNLENGAPSSGLPAYVIADHAGTALPAGTNDMWLSLYSPLNLVTATANGRLVAFSPGTPELGVKAYSAFVQVPPESTAVLTVTLDGHVTAGRSYRLALRLQPLAYAPAASISVQPAPGWEVREPANWQALNKEVQARMWQFSR
jgi:hypothetical protein